MRALVFRDAAPSPRFLARLLVEEGLTVDECWSTADVVSQAESGLYDLIFVDASVSRDNALDVCRDVRHAGGTAAIMVLLHEGSTDDRVLGLEAGADDCMVEPLGHTEIVARIRALLRRRFGFATLRCGEIEIDRATRQVRVAGATLRLTNREYALLLHLAHRAGKIVKRSELLAHVWGIHFDPTSNLLEVHVRRLRQKLGVRARMIQTMRGVGYRMSIAP